MQTLQKHVKLLFLMGLFGSEEKHDPQNNLLKYDLSGGLF
jgi:hypothetical protein